MLSLARRLTVIAGLTLQLVVATSDKLVVHEILTEQDAARRLSIRSQPIPEEAAITIRFGLTQQNHERAYKKLIDVSSPASPGYGRHLSNAEVVDLFAPNSTSIDLVKQWLVGSGISEDNIIPYQTRGWLSATMNASMAKNMMQAEYHEYNHDGRTRIGCSSYSIPQSLQAHIDYVTPGVKLSAPVRKMTVYPRSQESMTGLFARAPAPQSNLDKCIDALTPECFRSVYNIPDAPKQILRDAIGVYEFGDSYAQSDLDAYYKSFASSIPSGTGPQVRLIDGATAPVNASSDRDSGEADVDLDIAISLVYPQPVVLYQVDDLDVTNAAYARNWSGVYNTFLDAIDGSYCNLTAYGITGDTPSIDGQYPDPAPGGYKGPLMCGAYSPTTVISVSNAQAEGDFPERYQKRQCLEFMKLALLGHTILFPSGDTGVASYPGDGSDSGCLSGSGQNQTIFAPYTPSGCPFVTSVGGTQLQKNSKGALIEVALNSTGTTSGGGFSNIFTAPEYQKSALQRYFTKHNPGYQSYNASRQAIGADGGLYNRAGRGYPDVSGIASNFITVIGGETVTGSGTSVSVPLWASIITLINAERSAANKSSVGFINPTLYEHAADVLHDVSNGSNPGCGTAGFSAVEGWDPVTGLGSPDYPKLLQLFLSLP